MVDFSTLSEGQFIEILFPRGGSISGTVVEIHLERPDHPWILVAQTTGAKTTVYQNEVGLLVTDESG